SPYVGSPREGRRPRSISQYSRLFWIPAYAGMSGWQSCQSGAVLLGFARRSMIPKSGYRFSEKIMLNNRRPCSCSSVGSERLTVDQEVGGSNPPSCTSARFYHAEGDMTRFRVAKRLAVAALSSLVIAGTVGSAYAQEKYPTRPITFIVPFAAGGPTDILARLIGQSVGLTLGQQVVVEDVTGAGGTIGATRAARRDRPRRTFVIGDLRSHAARPRRQ